MPTPGRCLLPTIPRSAWQLKGLLCNPLGGTGTTTECGWMPGPGPNRLCSHAQLGDRRRTQRLVHSAAPIACTPRSPSPSASTGTSCEASTACATSRGWSGSSWAPCPARASSSRGSVATGTAALAIEVHHDIEKNGCKEEERRFETAGRMGALPGGAEPRRGAGHSVAHRVDGPSRRAGRAGGDGAGNPADPRRTAAAG